VGTRGNEIPGNERLKARPVGGVLPLAFALVDPWWTLRDMREAPARAWIVVFGLGAERSLVQIQCTATTADARSCAHGAAAGGGGSVGAQ
jgi:hypothetical protein